MAKISLLDTILLGKNYPCTTEAPSTSSLRAVVVKLEAKSLKTIEEESRHKVTSLLDQFNCEEFLLPGRRHKHSSPDPAEKVVRVHSEVEVHKQVNIQLANELAEKSQELSSAGNKYDKLKQQHEASISKIRNKNKLIKRRDLALSDMDESLQTSKELVAATKEDLETAEKKISELRRNQKRLNDRISYWKTKAQSLACADDDEVVEELIHYHEEIEKLNKQIIILFRK